MLGKMMSPNPNMENPLGQPARRGYMNSIGIFSPGTRLHSTSETGLEECPGTGVVLFLTVVLGAFLPPFVATSSITESPKMLGVKNTMKMS